MRKSRFGIPYFEIGLACVLVAILSGAWIERFWYYRELTEKTVFEQTVRHMQTGLRYEKARRIMAGESLEKLAGVNPLNYLKTRPEHDLGECETLDSNLVRKSGWLFVRKEHTLYYLPLIKRHLRTDAPALAIRLEDDVRIITPYQWF